MSWPSTNTFRKVGMPSPSRTRPASAGCAATSASSASRTFAPSTSTARLPPASARSTGGIRISGTLQKIKQPSSRRSDRAEQPVHRLLGGAAPAVRAGREEQRPRRPGKAAVPERERPEAADRDRLPIAAVEDAVALPPAALAPVGGDRAVAEVPHQQVAAEPAEAPRSEREAPRLVQAGVREPRDEPPGRC